jgi:hypothetical protein
MSARLWNVVEVDSSNEEKIKSEWIKLAPLRYPYIPKEVLEKSGDLFFLRNGKRILVARENDAGFFGYAKYHSETQRADQIGGVILSRLERDCPKSKLLDLSKSKLDEYSLSQRLKNEGITDGEVRYVSYIESAEERIGVGRAIMNGLMEEKNVSMVFLHSVRTNAPFYQKLGFRQLGYIAGCGKQCTKNTLSAACPFEFSYPFYWMPSFRAQEGR